MRPGNNGSHLPQIAAKKGQCPFFPRVSFGVPVYNGERYLPAALDAILAQTFSDFEVVISDNASLDRTSAICQQYAKRDSRIIYHREPINRGAAWNFNRVFELAKAPYFKWTAADDLFAPQFVASCIEVLESDPTIVCCHSRTQKIDEHGNALSDADDPTDGGLPSSLFLQPRPHRTPHRPDASSFVPHLRFRDVLLSSGWSARSYGLIRKDQLQQTKLFQPYYGYEKVTMAELALRGRFHDVSDTLFFQRVHKQASSQLKTGAQQRHFFAAQSHCRAGTRWPLLQGYLRAIRNAPIDGWQRLRCRGWIVRYLMQMHKWPSVLDGALAGCGVGKTRKTAQRSLNGSPCGLSVGRQSIVRQEH
jgi:glycosyltransferase involved in cell wall biosynthesis